MRNQREAAIGQAHWASKVGVILAVAGSAVGLGNFLRFPGQVAANGGGAFMIPYFCALVLVGVPLGWIEWSIGRRAGRYGLHSAPAVLAVLSGRPWGRYLGALGVVVPLIISFYYTFIESWCLVYLWEYLSGGIGVDTALPIAEQSRVAREFHAQVSGVGQDGSLFRGGSPTLVAWAFTFALNLLLIWRGLAKGIERLCVVAMPLMAVCAVVVLIRVLTLGTPDPTLPEQNVVNGLGYMWNPDFSALANPQTWLRAAGQIFFSLSLGFGVIINYASYLNDKDDVVLSGLTASSTNEFFEVGFGGLITVTAAFVFFGASGTAIAVSSGSFGLGFHTLPVVFAQMGTSGTVVGAIWFFMLFLAALTSSLSMYQPVVAFLEETFELPRARGTALTAVCCAIGSLLVLYFSKQSLFLATLDEWVGTFLVFLLGSMELLLFAWVLGVDRGLDDAELGAAIRIPRWYRPIIKYVAPLYLLAVFAAFCFKNLPHWVEEVAGSSVRQGAVVLIALTLLGVLAAIRFSKPSALVPFERQRIAAKGKHP